MAGGADFPVEREGFPQQAIRRRDILECGSHATKLPDFRRFDIG